MHYTQKKEEAPLERVDLRTLGIEQSTEILPALQFQHRFFLQEMKGALLPAQFTLEGNEVLLDFPCGPGSWCIDVSRRYSRAQVYGADTNQALIALALENAGQCGSSTLHFQRIKDPCVMPFAEATFDVIHLQQGASLFSPCHWPHLLAEMARLLKPGGWLNLVDFEMGFVSEPTLDRVLTFLRQMLDKMGHNPAPGGTFPAAGSVLGPHRMAQQGFTEIGYQLSPVDLGRWNNLAGRAYLVQCMIRPAFLMALAERMGIGTKEEMQVLVREAQRELRHVSFCGAGILLSSFGRKPSLPAPDAGYFPESA